MFPFPAFVPVVGGFSNTKALQGAAASYLSRTFGAGNRSKFALSYFVRTPSSFPGAIRIFGAASNEDGFDLVSGKPTFMLNNGASGEQWTTNALATSSYSHVYHEVDTTNATAGDRLRVWVDGSEVTSFGRDNNPTLNEQCGNLNNSVALRIGRATNDVSAWANTWIVDEIAFFDGQLPGVTAVRDSGTGKPKDLSALNFGTTGFWLRFEGGTAATVGNDSSGLGNNWTGANVVDGDLVSTVP